MRKWILFSQIGLLSATLLLLSGWDGCGWGDDDDDDTTPPVDITPTPDDWSPTPEPPKTTISGTIYAVDRSTGEALTDEEYAARAGAIVVYALRDPDNWSYTLGKATLVGPGYYEMLIKEDVGDVYVVAVADWDFNTVITNYDVARESVSSPVTVVDAPLEGVDVTLDLPQHGGGGSNPGSGPFSGTVVYDSDDADTTNIAVVAFRGDYTGYIFGMSTQVGQGDYGVNVGLWAESTSLIGYADADGNGLYEPCDPAGLAEKNPYALTSAGAAGVDILIEGVGPGAMPQPIPYISVSGTVQVDEFYNGTPIDLLLTSSNGRITYAALSLAEPGDFGIRVPGNLSDLVLTAYTDSNGDGIFDPSVDASGSYGPFNVGTSSFGGIDLLLVTPEEPDTGITGTVSYSGAFSENDQLVMALFTDPDRTDGPVALKMSDITSFPVDYEWLDLGSVLDDLNADQTILYLAVAIDINRNWDGGPGEDDYIGIYSTDGSNMKGITIERGQVLPDINVSILEH